MKNCAPMSVCEKNMKAQVSRCEKLVISDDTLKCKLTNNFHCQHNDTERDMCIFKKPNDTKWKCFDKSNHEIYSNKHGEFNQTDVEYCMSVWLLICNNCYDEIIFFWCAVQVINLRSGMRLPSNYSLSITSPKIEAVYPSNRWVFVLFAQVYKF